MRKQVIVITVAGLIFAGCAEKQAQISAIRDFVTVDLNAAKANFDLAKMPTEAACVQSIIDLVGAQAAQQFQINGLVSAGSVAYIKYAQLRGGQNQIQVSDACYATFGKIAIAATREGAGAFSGGLVR